MNRVQKIAFGILFLALVSTSVVAQPTAYFIPNKGQWAGDFHTKLPLAHGALFFKSNGYKLSLLNLPGHSHGAESQHSHTTTLGSSYQMEFLNALAQPQIKYTEQSGPLLNYFLGKNPKNWVSGLQAFKSLTYFNIYEGIHLEFSQSNDALKYNIVVAAGADPTLIEQHYQGLRSLDLKDGILNLETHLGLLTESIPEAFQIINGEKILVECSYRLKGQTVSFNIGTYNPDYELVIDPLLVFSTFSGSGDLNYGNTATPAKEGRVYAAGTNFGPNYPTTLGAVQPGFAADSIYSCDVAISKFSKDGSALLYATYLGGQGVEVPQSLIADPEDNLYILGVTGASDFPITGQAYQSTFNGGNYISNGAVNHIENGADLFMAKLSANGSQLLAATYWGGSGNEGYNILEKNYGDHFRGELILTPQNQVAVVSSTTSMDLSASALPNGPKTEPSQDALVGVFDKTLSTNLWTSFLGNDQIDAGYALQVVGPYLYITGGTLSSSFPSTSGALQTANSGDVDGFIGKFDLTTGDNVRNTFIGTPDYDQSYLIQSDGEGIFVFGQTQGDWVSTPSKFSVNNATQFLLKIDTSLSTLNWQTTLGSGQDKQDLVPSAFLVDHCRNIYLAGWNGQSNTVGNPPQQNGNTHGLPTLLDAYQSTTDGNDFYFMVLSREAQKLLYASFFGGADHEHVDGGTSRFDKDGTVYQAVCSNCMNLGFPTTLNAYSASSGAPSCNMAVFKFKFDQTLEADANVSFTTEVDSICDGLVVKFSNASLNATNYKWIFGNGDSSTLAEPTVTYNALGNYKITFLAVDTICGIADTLIFEIDHSEATFPKAKPRLTYQACDQNFNATLDASESFKAQRFTWEIAGRNQALSGEIEKVQFNNPGPHQVRLIVKDTVCNRSDTSVSWIYFNDTLPDPVAQLNVSECSNGSIDIALKNHQDWYQYSWLVNGQVFHGPNPPIRFRTPGNKNVRLTIQDTLCNKEFHQSFRLHLKSIRHNAYIPTAFSPNGDGLNETFKVVGDGCESGNYLVISNRWGAEVFKTKEPFNHFWDGTINGVQAPAGVYTYQLKNGDEILQGSFTLIR